MLVMPSVAVKVDNQMSPGESEEKESGVRHTLEDTPRSQFKRIVEEWESRQVADAPRTLTSLSPAQKSLHHGGKEPPAAGNSIKLDPRESSPPRVKDGSLRRPVDWSSWEEKRTASAVTNTTHLDPPRGSANELSFSTLCRDGDAAQGTRVVSTSTSRDDEGKWDLEMAIAIGLANRTIHTEAQQEAAALRALRSRAPAGPLEDDLFELSGNQLNLSNGDQFSFSLPRMPEKILPSSPKFGATSPPRRSWERDTAAAAAAKVESSKVGAAGLDSFIQKLKASKIESKSPQPPPATNQLSGREEVISSPTSIPVKHAVAPDILDSPTVDLEADRPRPDPPSSLNQIPPLRPKRSSKWSDMPWEDDPLSEGRRRVPDSAARWARAAARRTGPIFHGVDSLEDVKRKLREAYQPQVSPAGTTTTSAKASNNNNSNNGKQPSISNHPSSIGRSLPTEPLQNKAGTLVAATSDVETSKHRRSLQAAPDPEREEQRRSSQAASDQETGGERRRSLQALATVSVQVVAARRPGEMQVPVVDSNKRVAALADINGQPRQVSSAGVGPHAVKSLSANGSETGIRALPLKTQHPGLQRSASAGSRSAHGVHRGLDRSEEQEGHHRNRSPRKDQRKNRSHEEVSAAKGEAAKSVGGGEGTRGRHVRSSANMLYRDEMSQGGSEGDTKWRTVEAAMDAAVVVGRGYVEQRGKVEGRPLRGVSPFRKARMASGSEDMQKGYMSGSSSLGSDSRKAGMSTGSESSLPTRNGWYIHENAVVMTLDEAIKHGIVVSMVPSSLANTDSSSGGQTSYGSATPQGRKDVPQLQHPSAGNVDVVRNRQKASPPRDGRTVTFDTDESKEMRRSKSMNDRNRNGMATTNYISPHAEDVRRRSMPSNRLSWLQCLNPMCSKLPLTLMDLSDDEDTISTTSAGTGGTGGSRDRRRSLERDSSRGSEPGAHHRQRSLNWRMHGRKSSE